MRRTVIAFGLILSLVVLLGADADVGVAVAVDVADDRHAPAEVVTAAGVGCGDLVLRAGVDAGCYADAAHDGFRLV